MLYLCIYIELKAYTFYMFYSHTYVSVVNLYVFEVHLYDSYNNLYVSFLHIYDNYINLYALFVHIHRMKSIYIIYAFGVIYMFM